MNKSEIRQKVASLQKEVSAAIKEKKYVEALDKLNSILEIAPNLQKVKDLKKKVELLSFSSAGKTKEEKPVKEEKPAPDTPEKTEEEDEYKVESDINSLDVSSIISEAKEKEENKKAYEANKPASDANVEMVDDLKVKKVTEEEKPKEKENIFKKKLAEKVDNNQKEEELKAILDTVDDIEQLGDEHEAGEEAGEDEELSPEAVEERLNKLLQQEHEEGKSGIRSTDDLAAMLKKEKEEPEKEKDLSVLFKGDEQENKTEKEESLKPLTEEEKLEQEITSKIQKAEVAKDEEEQKEDLQELLGAINDDPKGSSLTTTPPSPISSPPEKKAPTPELNIPAPPKKEEKTEKESTFKLGGGLNDVTPPKEVPKAPKPAAPSSEDKKPPVEISRDGGIPTIIGKKKEKSMADEFKLSGNSGITAGATQRNEQVIPRSLDINRTLGTIKAEGFQLRHITQAAAFVFNIERLLYSTAGILFAIAISFILSQIVPTNWKPIGIPLIYSTFFTILGSFIALTINKQINEQQHNNFRSLFPEFAKEMLFPSSVFWLIWLVLAGILFTIMAVISITAKMDGFGPLLYSILSPVNFFTALILSSLLLASGIVSFILPAIIAIEKPGLFTVLKEVLFTLKNHIFTIIGGAILNFVLNFFIALITLIILALTYTLIGALLLIFQPTYLSKLILSLPQEMQMMLTQNFSSLQQLVLGNLSTNTDSLSIFGYYIFLITMIAGSVFLISIPFIFRNGASVITLLTIKGKPDILGTKE